MEPGEQPQTAVKWVLEHPTHKRNTDYILLKLAWCIDQGNDCPSHRELAEMTGLSKDTVRRALGELQKDGTIAITKNGGGKVKGGQKDCYAIIGYTRMHTATSTQQPGSNEPGSTEQPGSMVQPLKHEQPESSTGEYVHAGGDAAGEKDLSLRAKEKDKSITPLTPQGVASDDAGVVLNKPKRERKPPEKKPPMMLQDDDYHRLRRGVALRSWGIDPENPAMREMLGKSDFARIGKIVSWLQGIKASPEKLSEFYTWYKLQYDTAAAPKDAIKFQEHFLAFVQSRIQPVTLIINPAYVPVQERQHLPVSEVVTLEDMERIQQEFKARKAQGQEMTA